MHEMKKCSVANICSVEQHAAAASTRLSSTRSSRCRSVDDRGGVSACLGGDDNWQVNLLGLRRLLSRDCDGSGCDGRRSRSDGRLLGCRDGLRGGSTSDQLSGSDRSLVGDGLGALVRCTLVERVPLEVRSTLGDELPLELLARGTALKDLTLEAEASAEPAGPGLAAEGVEDLAKDAAEEALVKVDDVFGDLVQVSKHVWDDCCDRVLDVAGRLDRARSSDGGGARDNAPGLGVLSESDEATSLSDGCRLRSDGVSSAARSDR